METGWLILYTLFGKHPHEWNQGTYFPFPREMVAAAERRGYNYNDKQMR